MFLTPGELNLAGPAIGFLGGYLGARLGQRTQHYGKLWERRAATYVQMVSIARKSIHGIEESSHNARLGFSREAKGIRVENRDDFLADIVVYASSKAEFAFRRFVTATDEWKEAHEKVWAARDRNENWKQAYRELEAKYSDLKRTADALETLIKKETGRSRVAYWQGKRHL